MDTLIFKHTRRPGPFAGLKRECLQRDCSTTLNQFHDAFYCYAHSTPLKEKRAEREAGQDEAEAA